MSEEVVGEFGEGLPEVVAFESVVEFDGNSFEVFESFAFVGEERSGSVPGFAPVGGPLDDMAGVMGIAGVDHLGDGTGKRDLDDFLSVLGFGESGPSPEDLGVALTLGSIIIVGFDGDELDFGAHEPGHEDVSGFVVGDEFGHEGGGKLTIEN